MFRYLREDIQAIFKKDPAGKDALAEWQGAGHDAHSRVADLLFVAPQTGDFALRPGSPTLALGFHPIDLVGIGAGG